MQIECTAFSGHLSGYRDFGIPICRQYLAECGSAQEASSQALDLGAARGVADHAHGEESTMAHMNGHVDDANCEECQG